MGSQSLMLSTISSDDRPLILSTPRRRNPGDVHVHINFSNPAIDDLFRMKAQPDSVFALQITGALGGLDVLINNVSDLAPVPLQLVDHIACKGFWPRAGNKCARAVSPDKSAAGSAGGLRPRWTRCRGAEG